MVSYRTRGVYSLTLFAQVLILSALFWIWLVSLNGTDLKTTGFLPRYAIYNIMIVLGTILGSKQTPALRLDFWAATRLSFRQVIYAGMFLLVFLVGSKDQAISRAFGFSYFCLLYLVLVATNRFMPSLVARLALTGRHQERFLLVGSSKKLAYLQSWIESKEQVGCTTVGLLCDDSEATSIGGIKVLGKPRELERAITEWSITQVVMIEFPVFSSHLSEAAGTCERLGVRFVVFCDFESKFHHAVSMFEDEGMRFITLRQEPLEDPFNRFLKRALDICVSLPVILCILPFSTILVWFLQRRESPGPVFLRQRRAGLLNQPFEILKYRTMHTGNFNQAVQAKEGDSRIYKSGHMLRKLSIDELPQFVNVFLGDMSVVGPRPHLEQHNEQFARALHNYHVRAHVKPGITGLAQVRGFRGETKTQQDVVKRIKADIAYLENWSLWTDISIIGQTYIQMFIPPKTAR